MLVAMSFLPFMSCTMYNHLGPFPKDGVRGRYDTRKSSLADMWDTYRRPSPSRSRPETIIDDFIENVMTCRHVPGISVSVVSGDQVFLQKGYGKAHLGQDVEATEDTPFCIGSCTKAFVSTLLGILLEEHADR